jgi:hypothetical protein
MAAMRRAPLAARRPMGSISGDGTRSRRVREIEYLQSLESPPFPFECTGTENIGAGLHHTFTVILSPDDGKTMLEVTGIEIFMPFDVIKCPTVVIPMEWITAHPKALECTPDSEFNLTERGHLQLCSWTPVGSVRDALAVAYFFLLGTL